MKATFNHETQTYTLTDIPAHVAHILVWGGIAAQTQKAEEELRQALVMCEDNDLSEDEYRRMREAQDSYGI